MAVRWLGAGLGAAAVVTSAAAVVATTAVHWSFDETLNAFVISNLVIGVSFALCGALIAWHRPGLLLGWLYAVGGFCQVLSGLAAPLGQLLHEHGAPLWIVRLDMTVFNWAWPINIGLAIPLSLLLLPDGRLASRRWVPVAAAVAVTSPLFLLEVGLGQETPLGMPRAYLTLQRYDDFGWLWTLSEVRWALSVLVGLACLAFRYRRGTEAVRRQLLWLVLAVAVIVVAVTPWALVAGTPLLVLFTIPLLPAAVAVAVLRHGLLDIKLVVSRVVTYALLSGLVLAAYAGLVVVLSGVASALLVAMLALPVRARLQAVVDRLLYGERGNPVRVASRVGQSLSGGLSQTLEEVRAALRLPYVAVVVGDEIRAAGGTPGGSTASLPLEGGVLVVGLRSGERRLSSADSNILRMLSGPLSTALHATDLLRELKVSRERLVLAEEDERRRLRRELHDGLGPLLTGVALSADMAHNLASAGRAAGWDAGRDAGRDASLDASRDSDRDAGSGAGSGTDAGPGAGSGAGPDAGTDGRLLARLDEVRSDSRTAIREVRRIVDNLGSPALDELGLAEALRIRAARTTRRADGSDLVVHVEIPADLPRMPAAVELAAYRIATEALTNVVRHSSATTVRLRLTCDGELRCEVLDDGAVHGSWPSGVGISSMRERAAELGGRCDVGTGPEGGHVRIFLPMAAR
ncbi:sensor histidine kinase [Pedococcus bigeumensis]|nr:histidine kinase [Pedococcus bigeumensis]